MTARNLATLALAASLFGVGLVSPASAVQPQRWTHSSEADFQAGTVQDTVVTNLGDIKLATGSRIIGEMPEQASIIYDLQTINGRLYVAAGPEAALLRATDEGELDAVVTLPNEQVFTLGRLDGRLLAAISGEESRLAVLDGDELVTVAAFPELRYLWDVVVDGDVIYVAGGTDGQVLSVQRDADGVFGEPDTVLETPQANVLTLAQGGDGRLYAGTDTDGLVYRLTPGDDGEWEAFVLYDAPEPEVAALLVRDDGTIFAGTADAEQARPGRLEEAVADPAGRPDAPAAEPAPPAEDDVPAPDDIPAVPPEPDPIGDPDDGDGDGEDGPGEPEPQDDEPGEAEGDADDDVEDVTPPEPDRIRSMIQRWHTPEPAGRSHGLQPLNEDNADDDDGDRDGDAGGDAGDDGDADAPDGDGDEAAAAEADDEERAQPAGPTAEQRDALREQVRGRLEEARETGTLQSGTDMAPRRASRSAPAGQRSRSPQQSRPSQQGNAIYRIDPQGFVSEVFRESVMIFRIVEAGNRLLVATGNEGQVFSINPRTEETTIVTDLDPEQVTTILTTDDGTLLMGTANAAQLVQLDDRFANRGTYTSDVLDANQISLWGALRVTAEIPEGTSVLVETRSGNVADPEHAPWSEWSEAQVFVNNQDASALRPRETKVASPPARFLQYRVTLVGGRERTPVVGEVDMAYVMPNLPPKLRTVRSQYPEARGRGAADAAPTTRMNIEWEASDPNEDDLVHKVEYQPAGTTRYLLVTEDARESSFEWETRRVPDGRYTIRVTASDRPGNPPDMARTATRRSDAVLVDNTAPSFEELAAEPGDGSVRVTGLAVDEFSPIQSIAYAVNSTDDYVPVLPEDMILDSTREPFDVTIPDLDSGQHVVTLRVRDTRGNTRHRSLMVEVE